MKYITNKHISKKLTAPLLCMALCGVKVLSVFLKYVC